MTNIRERSVNSLIKYRRKQLKYSQSDLAKAVKLSLRQYQYIESGKGRIYVDLLQKLCEELSLSIMIVQSEGIL